MAIGAVGKAKSFAALMQQLNSANQQKTRDTRSAMAVATQTIKGPAQPNSSSLAASSTPPPVIEENVDVGGGSAEGGDEDAAK